MKELDFLGLQCQYDERSRSLKILATKAIERLRKKFNFQENRAITMPAIREDLTPTKAELEQLAANEKSGKNPFPTRSPIGG